MNLSIFGHEFDLFVGGPPTVSYKQEFKIERVSNLSRPQVHCRSGPMIQ